MYGVGGADSLTNTQSSRGGISVDTDYRDSQITSRLTIAMVTPEDSGKYTCRDADVKPDTVTLLVVEGEIKI